MVWMPSVSIVDYIHSIPTYILYLHTFYTHIQYYTYIQSIPTYILM
jgi:hypothetical protein